MFSPREVELVAREFERLGVPPHDHGRMWTFECAAGLSGREILRRLRDLPDGAGVDAAMTALDAPPSIGP